MASFGLTRTIVRTFIPELYSTYKTASKALEYLQSIGFGYRKKDFLADWREILDIEAKKDTWKYIRKDRTPSEDMYVESEQFLTGKYLNIGKIVYIDKDGFEQTEYTSFYSNKRMKVSDMESYILNDFIENADKYEVKLIVSVDMVGGKKQKGVK